MVPSLPLMLISISVSLSTFLTILSNNGKSFPVVSVLVSATWLWSGEQRQYQRLGAHTNVGRAF